MTDSQRHPDAPSNKQLRYLRDLAMSRGESFTPPRTKAQASSEIDRLKGRRARSSSERRYEDAEMRRALSVPRGDGAAIRRREVVGYGSSAAWKDRA